MLKPKYIEINSYTNNYKKRKSYLNSSSPKVKLKNTLNQKDNIKDLLTLTTVSAATTTNNSSKKQSINQVLSQISNMNNTNNNQCFNGSRCNSLHMQFLTPQSNTSQNIQGNSNNNVIKFFQKTENVNQQISNSNTSNKNNENIQTTSRTQSIKKPIPLTQQNKNYYLPQHLHKEDQKNFPGTTKNSTITNRVNNNNWIFQTMNITSAVAATNNGNNNTNTNCQNQNTQGNTREPLKQKNSNSSVSMDMLNTSLSLLHNQLKYHDRYNQNSPSRVVNSPNQQQCKYQQNQIAQMHQQYASIQGQLQIMNKQKRRYCKENQNDNLNNTCAEPMNQQQEFEECLQQKIVNEVQKKTHQKGKSEGYKSFEFCKNRLQQKGTNEGEPFGAAAVAMSPGKKLINQRIQIANQVKENNQIEQNLSTECCLQTLNNSKEIKIINEITSKISQQQQQIQSTSDNHLKQICKKLEQFINNRLKNSQDKDTNFYKPSLDNKINSSRVAKSGSSSNRYFECSPLQKTLPYFFQKSHEVLDKNKPLLTSGNLPNQEYQVQNNNESKAEEGEASNLQQVIQFPENQIDSYQFGKILGLGSYAIVRFATLKSNSKGVAIKTYEKQKLADPQKNKNVQREIKILSNLRHDNIIKLYNIIETNQQLHLVMEYCNSTPLNIYLKQKQNKRLSEDESKPIFVQIVEAIRYCHKKCVVHRDIKLENILIDPIKQIKLIDFGFSIAISAQSKLNIFCGTPSYMAPEIVNKKEYSFGVDVWAVGILLYKLLTGSFPFTGIDDKELFKKINNCKIEFPLHVSYAARSLVTKILRTNPKERLSPDDDEWIISSKQQNVKEN